MVGLRPSGEALKRIFFVLFFCRGERNSCKASPGIVPAVELLHTGLVFPLLEWNLGNLELGDQVSWIDSEVAYKTEISCHPWLNTTAEYSLGCRHVLQYGVE